VIRNCRGRIAESVAYSLRHAVARHFDLYREHVSRFVTPTQFSARWLAEHAGIPPERIRTIPFSFTLPESAADPGQGGYIAYAGRLVAEKGISTLIEAARRTGLPFRLAGDSMELRLAEGLPNVELVFTRSRAELMEFYRGARVLVVPSVWFETYPLVIGEAMSHGIPVIASRIGGLPELVRDGITGLLVEPGDAADLSEKIRQLWEDPDLSRRLGAGARAFIESECGESTFVERLKAVYAEVCL
jgi:glycosyltransferase involved in cell wall biosynthesis